MNAVPGFEPLPLRRRAVIPVGTDVYSIISPKGENKEVKARTAYEAFKLSGFPKARRIERVALAKSLVLSKARFQQEQAVEVQSSDAPPRIVVREQVVSADKLDSLMKSLNAAVDEIEAAKASNAAASGEAGAPAVNNLTGVEVHGDGFDELIPAALTPSQMGVVKQVDDEPAKPAKAEAKAAEAEVQAAAAVPQQTITPEQQLSQDDINKLLNG